MSLNELLRDNSQNKWANLNVQSVTSVTENVTTLNANTVNANTVTATNVNATTVNAPTGNISTLNAVVVNSGQESTLRQIIKGSDNPDNVIDMSNDLATARVVSKTVSSGVLQPYEITSCCLYWRKALPSDNNQIILSGTQLVTGTSVGTVEVGRRKIITFSSSGVGSQAGLVQSGGITTFTTNNGIIDIIYDPFTTKPTILLTSNLDSPDAQSLYVINITTTGCRIHTRLGTAFPLVNTAMPFSGIIIGLA